MPSAFRNRLAAARKARKWSQARAAEAAGISRQSYAAIESGASVPSTETSLRLARAWGCTIEDLFELADAPLSRVRARWAGREPVRPGERVRLARVRGRVIGLEVGGMGGLSGGGADGTAFAASGDEVEVTLLGERPPAPDLVVVGCDPAFGVIAAYLAREAGIHVEWVARGSRAALDAIAAGTAHVAGAHLHDAETGETNGPWIRGAIPFPCTRVAFANWEQGLLTTPGNPRGLAGLADLAGDGVRLANREAGSGSRMLLDEGLERAGIEGSGIVGYSAAVRSHFAVAESISSGLADAGVAIRAAGAAFGLDVIPLRTERYELVIPDHFLDLPAIGALLDALSRPGVRAQVESLQGYDAQSMGEQAF